MSRWWLTSDVVVFKAQPSQSTHCPERISKAHPLPVRNGLGLAVRMSFAIQRGPVSVRGVVWPYFLPQTGDKFGGLCGRPDTTHARF